MGAAAGALSSQGVVKAQAEANPLRVPKAVEESLSAPIVRGEVTKEGMTGAQVFANLCKDEGLAALFCAAGNYSIINEIAQVGIPCYGGRTEGGMCAAADGFSRVTGEVVACSGTEGPGFTHMIMNIASKHIEWTTACVIVVPSILFAVIGSRLARRVDEIFIRRVLGVYLLIMSLGLLVKKTVIAGGA